MKNIKIEKIRVLSGALLAAGLLFIFQPQAAYAACQNGKYQGEPRQCDTDTLSRGSRCDRVCALQERLKGMGWYTETVDGEFGPTTAQAVQSYQVTWNRLTPDDKVQINGVADSDTLAAIDTGYPTVSDADSQQVPPPGSGSPPPSTPPPGSGSPPPPAGSGAECPTGTSRDKVSQLCLPANPYTGNSIAGQSTIAGLITTVLKYLLTFAGIIAVVVLVIGGFWYITSAGNEETAEKGKNAIFNAIIGLVVIILAYAIVAIVSRTLATPVEQALTTK